VIWVERKLEYFFEMVWTGQISLIRLDKLAATRQGGHPLTRMWLAKKGTSKRLLFLSVNISIG
jgi:hypothetical protein